MMGNEEQWNNSPRGRVAAKNQNRTEIPSVATTRLQQQQNRQSLNLSDRGGYEKYAPTPVTGTTYFHHQSSDDDSSNSNNLSPYEAISSTPSEQSLRSNNGLQQQRRKRSLRTALEEDITALLQEVPPGLGNDSQILSPKGNFIGGNVLEDTTDFNSVPVSKYGSFELRILRQPEEQHRARYMSEGSRGAVKDRSGKSHCTVALCGYSQPAVLEVYAVTGSGTPVPHPLYRVIPVMGKNGSSVTSCKEAATSDGIPCLQVVLRPENKMTAVLDCIGILKICTYDLKRKLPKQNRSSNVRLVFRVTIPRNQNRRQNIVLQTISTPIICVQQPGYPDVARISCTSSSVRGNVDVFIVGKNFANNSVVRLKEYSAEGKLVWNAEAPVDRQHIHTCHIICTVPAYRDLSTDKAVSVSLTVETGKKCSRPITYKYFPEVPAGDPAQSHQFLGSMPFTADGEVMNSSPTAPSATAQPPGFQNVTEWSDFASSVVQEQKQYQDGQGQMQQLTDQILNMNQPDELKPQAQELPGSTFTLPASNLMDVDLKSMTQLLEPFTDDNNSFYFANQCSDEPLAKKQCTNDVFRSTDSLELALDTLAAL